MASTKEPNPAFREGLLVLLEGEPENQQTLRRFGDLLHTMVGETVRTPCPVPLVYAEAEAALVDLLELTERLEDAATYAHLDEPDEVQLGAVTGKQAKALRKVIAALEAGLGEMTADEEDRQGRRRRGGRPVSAPGPPRDPAATLQPFDLANVRAQEAAKRALEVAAAGGHSILLIGPRSSGKTMLARCLPGILPPPTPEERDAIAETYRRAKLEPPTGRPFRAPHFSTRPLALVGRRKPGEVDLARGGVLFLDDLPAFGRRSLRVLRQAIEEGTAPESSRMVSP